MATIERASGIRVILPETMALADSPPPRGKIRRFRKSLPPLPSPLETELIDALGGLDFELVDAVPIVTLAEPSDPTRRRRRGAEALPPSQKITFAAVTEPGERAVALIEQDGVYSWRFGEESGGATAESGLGCRRGPTEPDSTTVTFTIPIHASSSNDRRTRHFGVEHVFRPVKTFIFKIPAEFVVGQIVNRLERDIRTGLVHLKKPSANSWKPIKDPASLTLPADRSPRILLMIHGTFSSTLGGFGALGVTKFGKDFIKAALDSYDAVIGFDHRTLSVDPLENAEEVLAELKQFRSKQPIRFDALCHSRGGLVYRSLVEVLAPASEWDATFGRAVFVGATNAGTKLADTENWDRLINLYTNLAIGSMKALGSLAPQSKLVTSILGGLLQGLAKLVQAMASAAIDEKQAVGLAAMDPDGDFVTNINKVQPDQPAPGVIDYYAITSNFEPRFEDDEQTLPAKLLRAVADGAADKLFREENDLVVNVDSMKAIDPHVEGFVTDALELGTNPRVYHTNYFHQKEVTEALGGWLKVNDPTVPWLQGVGSWRQQVPAHKVTSPYINSDLLVINSSMNGAEVRRLLGKQQAEFVVVRNQQPFATHHYAYRPHELRPGLRPQVTLQRSLNLHERNRSIPGRMGTIQGYNQRQFNARYPAASRTVVFRGDVPTGVVPNALEMRASGKAATVIQPRRIQINYQGRSFDPPRQAHRNSALGRKARPALKSRSFPRLEPLPEAHKAHHFFRAQMPAEVIVDEVTTVEVVISREQLDLVANRAGRLGQAMIDTDRKIIVMVMPRRNFALAADGRCEIDPVAAGGEPRSLYFDVRPTHEGDGDIDVVVRQGQSPLLTMRLETKIVSQSTPAVAKLSVTETAVTDAPHMKEPVNQLTVWESIDGEDVKLDFHFSSPLLNENKRARHPTTVPGGTESYVADIYDRIESSWTNRDHTPATFTKDLQSIGMAMFEDLVPLEIRELLWKYRKRLDNIQILSNEPFIPWEIVHLKQPGKVGRGEWFLGQLGLVRWLENIEGNGFGPETIDIQKALAIVPEYPKDSTWRLDEPEHEYKFLHELVNATKVPPNRIAVDSVLEEPGSFDLLHYAGHGEAPMEDSAEAELILAVKRGRDRWIKEALDATTVEFRGDLATNGRRPMVVLNACQVGRMHRRLTCLGGFSKAFLTAGAGAFVGSLWSVGDEPARSFVEALYTELAAGKNISEAAIEAREQARKDGDFTWLSYTVYANPHATVTM